MCGLLSWSYWWVSPGWQCWWQVDKDLFEAVIVNLQVICIVEGELENDIADELAGQCKTAARLEAQEALDDQYYLLR